MAKPRNRIAEWLCDNVGEDGETPEDLLEEADDLVNFLWDKNIVVVHFQHLTKEGQIIERGRRRREKKS